MSKIRIGVLRGGPSNEYDISLMSGQNVLENLGEDYEVSDILITKNGAWNFDGLQSSPIRAMRRTDLFFNALHGGYGEDGKLQQMLDGHFFRYTGSGTLSSALAMNKILAKKYFHKAGLLTPRSIYFKNEPPLGNIRSEEELIRKRMRHILEAFSAPWVIKPISGGSSMGVSFVRTLHELEAVLSQNRKNEVPIFIEEMVYGKEVTCGVLEYYKGEKHVALPPLEIILENKSGFFDYNSKYHGGAKEVPFGSLSEKNIQAIQRKAVHAHETLGLRHYSRMDALLTPRGEVYILEVNTLPGLSKESLFSKALEAAKIDFSSFLKHVITQAAQ